jgi:quercetin dioxygenase-like cupin family protein
VTARVSSIVLGPGEGRSIATPVRGHLSYKVRSWETAGTVTVFEAVAPPGGGPPLHRHNDSDEFIYVLEGELRVRLGAELRAAPPGSFVFIPKGLAHTWQNAGQSPARFLAGLTPASPGLEEFFERAAGIAENRRLTEGFQRFADEARMDVLGPPL